MNFVYVLIIINYLLLFGAVWMIKMFLDDLSDELKIDRGFFKGLHDIDHKYVNDLENFCREMAKEADATTANEKKIVEEYQKMQEATLVLSKHICEIIANFNKIEEKYSTTYEEFNYIRGKLDELTKEVKEISDWCNEWEDEESEMKDVSKEPDEVKPTTIQEHLDMIKDAASSISSSAYTPNVANLGVLSSAWEEPKE